MTTNRDSNPNGSFYSHNVNEVPYQKRLFFQDKSTNFKLHPHLSSTSDTIDDFTKKEYVTKINDICKKIFEKFKKINSC